MHGWAAVPGYVRRAWGPGWALVGDAGNFKDPISTHGITDALRDAELLATAVQEALAGLRPEPLALAEYQAQRDRLSYRLLDVTDRIAAYDWDMPQIRRLLRELSSSMVDEVEALEGLAFRQDPNGWAGNVRPDRVPAHE
jgi:flavin-dependent dehydrogenase